MRFVGSSFPSPLVQAEPRPGVDTANTTATYVVRYEDLKADPVKVLEGLYPFLYPEKSGDPPEPPLAILKKAVAGSTFDVMRRKEKRSPPPFFSKLHGSGIEKAGNKFELVREGKVGKESWGGCFGEEEEAERFWKKDRRVMEAFGYDM